MTKIINLIGGPGVGKSTMAAGVFHEMKKQGKSCELVSEYAKDLVWEKNEFVFNHQLIILSKQYRRLARLLDQVDYVITDSPLILGCSYVHINRGGRDSNFHAKYREHMEGFILETFKLFNNVNFLIERNFEAAYEQVGRRENLRRAEFIDNAIKNTLVKHDIPYHPIDQNYSIQKLITQI